VFSSCGLVGKILSLNVYSLFTANKLLLEETVKA